MNPKKTSVLRLNVGFLLSQTAGYSREFEIEASAERVGEDLTLHDLHGRLRLTRTAQGLFAQGDLAAAVPAQCVRCLTEFSQPLSIHIADLFVTPPSQAGDPLLVVHDDMHLHLGPLVRESMLLDVPLQPLCQPDCKGLCPECGGDRNRNECHCGRGASALERRRPSLQLLALR